MDAHLGVTRDSEGDVEEEDTPMDELDPERVARNLALHMAAADGNLTECKLLLDGSNGKDGGDGNGKAEQAAADAADDEEEEYADAWWEDVSSMNWSALHFAANGGHTDVVRFLLQRGAIWNAIDELGMTAADIAWSYNDQETYNVLFEEGVRQTLVLNLLNRQGYAGSTSRLPSATTEADGSSVLHLNAATESADEVSASNERFLSSKLRFITDAEGKRRCLDQDDGLVMAAWETDVMQKTAQLLCAASPNKTGQNEHEGLRVLNIGFGLGIVDECLQHFKPSRHVIVEAHPDAVRYAESQGWNKRPGVEIIAKRWEDALDELSSDKFDVIYWDTYAQGYGELRDFFEEVPYLLAGPQARFSFFHGLAGTNRFLYDVYTRVAELDLRQMGMATEWHEVRPLTTSETWDGVLRRYWDLDVLRIPLVQLVDNVEDEK